MMIIAKYLQKWLLFSFLFSFFFTQWHHIDPQEDKKKQKTKKKERFMFALLYVYILLSTLGLEFNFHIIFKMFQTTHMMTCDIFGQNKLPYA